VAQPKRKQTTETLSDLRKQIHGQLMGLADGSVTPDQMTTFAKLYATEFKALERVTQPTEKATEVVYTGARAETDAAITFTIRRNGRVLTSAPLGDDEDAARLAVAEILLRDAVSAKAAELLAPQLARRYQPKFLTGAFRFSRSQLRAFVAQHRPTLLLEPKLKVVR
jgi:hypothetical protein